MHTTKEQRPPQPAVKLRAAALAAALCWGIAPAMATDYSAGYDINFRAKSVDNIRFTADNEVSVTGAVVSPVLSLDRETELSKLSFDAQLDFSYYDKDEFDTNDQYIDLGYDYSFETSAINLKAKVTRDSTITSEVLGTGIIGNTAERRESFSFDPSWIWYVNELNSISLGVGYVYTDYRSSNFTDYTVGSTTATWTYALTERMKLITQLFYSNFKTEYLPRAVPSGLIIFPGQDPIVLGYVRQDLATDTQKTGLLFGADYTLSERSTLSALLGRSRNIIDYPIKDPTDLCDRTVNPIHRAMTLCDLDKERANVSNAKVDWSFRGPIHSFKLSLLQDTQATGGGYQVEALRIFGTWEYRVGERSTLTTNLESTRNKALGEEDGVSAANARVAERDYQGITLLFRHRITQNWYVDTQYEYQHQEHTELNLKSERQALLFGIRYQPQHWHWSR